MDARARRSQEKLRDAILVLAARSPITDVTVSAVCKEAGVTRDTFYRHAAGPQQLLADALAAELAETLTIMRGLDHIGAAERALLTHVSDRAAVYRGAMHPSLVAPLRSNLEGAVREGLEVWAELHPDILPPSAAADESALRIATAYAAAGTAGAIEEWLRVDGDDVDRGVEMILAASPQWWLAEPDRAAGEERREG